MRQDNLIQAISQALQNDGRVLALFLAGSLGRGTADRFSDIDLLAVAPAEAHAPITTAFRSSLALQVRLVFWRLRLTDVSLVNAITEDWQRIDLFLIVPEQLPAYAQNALKPLFDTNNLFATLPPTSPPPLPNRARVAFLIEEFIRVLGLLPVVIGREEFEVGIAGAGLLRAHLTELLVETAGSPAKGGALHLSRILSPERRRTLRDLPTPLPTSDSLIEAHLATAQIFLPYARTVAAQLGLVWPTNFEAATWQYLGRELGIPARFSEDLA